MFVRPAKEIDARCAALQAEVRMHWQASPGAGKRQAIHVPLWRCDRAALASGQSLLHQTDGNSSMCFGKSYG